MTAQAKIAQAQGLQSQLKDFVFASESVAEGHPDKVCDRVSDAIVDLMMAADPEARVGCETMACTDTLVVAGEFRAPSSVTQEKIVETARNAVREIGYEQDGFNWKTLNIEYKMVGQSADIAQGVDASGNKDEGAGDQGIMFGYACRETDELMPAPVYLSHKILRRLSEDRHAGKLSMLGPDAKSQVSLEYRDGKPVRATSIVVSTQHAEGLSQSDVREIVRPYIAEVLPNGWMCEEDEFYVNPTGRFVIGGPVGDCGLTGRKIIVDTYGGAAPHGGGAFSGKDPTKVDRSAAYAARYLAKNIVSAGFADKCTIQLSYAIGVSKPLSVYVNCHETGQVDESELVTAIDKIMDLSPRGIRTHLKLNRAIYKKTSSYGHFGRKSEADGSFSWENCDLVDALKKAI